MDGPSKVCRVASEGRRTVALEEVSLSFLSANRMREKEGPKGAELVRFVGRVITRPSGHGTV